MPLDRAIEFKIVLLPSTAPIYKRPYLMASNELVEMKTYLSSCKNCFIRGIFDLAVHHGVVLPSLGRRRTRHCTCEMIIDHSMR
jgi:hypothetical protein